MLKTLEKTLHHLEVKKGWNVPERESAASYFENLNRWCKQQLLKNKTLIIRIFQWEIMQSYILCAKNMSFKLSNSHSYLKWICIGCTAELHVFQSVSPQVKEGFHMFTIQFPTRKEKSVPPKSGGEVRSQRWSFQSRFVCHLKRKRLLRKLVD